MTDLFREVDEEVRRDELAQVWKKYGSLITALAVAFVLAVAGWRYYTHRQEQAAQAAGARFEEALALIKQGKAQDGEAVLAELARGEAKGYGLLSRFRLAAEQAHKDSAVAVAAFDALANDPSVEPGLQDLARVRAASLLVDTASYKDILGRLERLAAPGAPWRNAAREILGLSAYRTGEFEAAGKWFDLIVVDRAAPPSQRQRAELMLDLVRAGPVQEN